jgi:hypothetical protein
MRFLREPRRVYIVGERSMRRFASVTTLFTVAFLHVHSIEADRRIDTVTLAGTPEQIGTLWGKINRDAIHEDVQKYVSTQSQVLGQNCQQKPGFSEKPGFYYA